MTQQHPAIIVGAGPAGLAAAAELGRRRIPAAVVERGDAVGASWYARYDRLRLNSSRWFSQLPGAEGNAEDSAQSAYAILFGLRGNSFYDPQLTPAQSNRLFKQALFRLAGLRGAAPVANRVAR